MGEIEIIQIKIEESKSWFILAQITIILAGFMFATSGIYWEKAVDSLQGGKESFNLAMDYAKENNSFASDFNNNFTKVFGLLAKEQMDLSIITIIFGFILTLLSAILFFVGKYNLSKLKKK